MNSDYFVGLTFRYGFYAVSNLGLIAGLMEKVLQLLLSQAPVRLRLFALLEVPLQYGMTAVW